MRSTITKGIDNIDSEAWATVTSGHPYADEIWCRYGENVLNAVGYYVIIYDENNQAVGGACFYILHNDYLPINNSLLYRAVRWYLQRYPMVVARTAYGTNHKGIFLPDDLELQAKVLAQILEAAKQIANENRASFLIFDYLENDDLTHEWRDFLKLPDFLDVGTVLDTSNYHSFEDYMQDLRQKKGKRSPKEVRRHSRKAIERGIQVTFQTLENTPQATLALIESQGDKYDAASRRPYTQEMIASGSKLPTDRACWMTACIEDELIACELIFFDTQTGVCSPSLFGRKQSVDFSYFYSFYEVIRYSIENLSAKKLIGGSTKEHFKLRKAYEPDFRNHFAVYLPSFLSRIIANILLSVLYGQKSDATDGPSSEEDFEYAEN